MSRIVLALFAITLTAGAAIADPIEGTWKRPNGVLVKIAACGTDFCVTGASGPHAGESGGKLTPGGGGKYAGALISPDNGKSITAKVSIAGAALAFTGCAAGGMMCKTESWARQ